MALSLYTVIMEFEGTTSVSQTTAGTVVEALKLWSGGLSESEHYGLAPASASRLLEALVDSQDDEPVQITGTTNVWCTSILVGKKSALLNIVKTSRR
jgi:uncharacterized protein YabE (DUF348 family)